MDTLTIGETLDGSVAIETMTAVGLATLYIYQPSDVRSAERAVPVSLHHYLPYSQLRPDRTLTRLSFSKRIYLRRVVNHGGRCRLNITLDRTSTSG